MGFKLGCGVEWNYLYVELAYHLGATNIADFEVAGKDGIFYSAEARIEGNSVLLTCSEVAEPAEVRYAWQPFTRANLVNGAGLPASTFKIRVSMRKKP